jgi:hypothetical protein
MKQRYLEVTYRKGKPFAAYLYLPRGTNAKSARTEQGGSGMRVDFDANGNPIGVEITAPSVVTSTQLSELLQRLGQPPLGSDEWAPLQAA